MLEQPSEESEGEDEEDDIGQEQEGVKGAKRATGKDLVPCETHPMDHVIEVIIADRLYTPKSSAKKSRVKKDEEEEETKEGTNEKAPQVDAEMKDEESKKETVAKKGEDKSDEASDKDDESESQSDEKEEIREEFLVKFKNLSYLEVRWLSEADFSNYSY